MLRRALGDQVCLQTLSFSRQYPAWLFPGASDRDPDYAGYREPGVDYEIDSLNPISWIRAVSSIRHRQTRLVIIPWWTVFWAPCFGYMAAALRRRNIDVVFLCHNVVEHEAAGWKQWLTRKVLGYGTRFVVHTRSEQANLRAIIPGAECAVQAHPVYDHFPDAEQVLPRRGGLELLFFGFVRPYKGLDILLEAMARLQGEDVHLTVAGEFWGGGEQVTRERIAELGIDRQVEIRARYHSARETAQLFERCDVVVLPYRSATGSGIVPVAYRYGKPVIASRTGGLPEVVEEGKTGWLVEPGEADGLAALIRTLCRDGMPDMRADIERIKRGMSWQSLASLVAGR
jgi:glycosyltransferase involved in cell wall biosynthesis